MYFWTSPHTYSDEGLVEAVETQVPDEPAADERGNKPEVEVGDHQERSASHHPIKQRGMTDKIIKLNHIFLHKYVK